MVCSQLPIKYIKLNVYFQSVESILEHGFFYKVCSSVNYPENEPTCKALRWFWFFMYSEYGVFLPTGLKSKNKWQGDQTCIDFAEIWHMTFFWHAS